MEHIEPRLFSEYYPDTVESYADHIAGFLKEQKVLESPHQSSSPYSFLHFRPNLVCG